MKERLKYIALASALIASLFLLAASASAQTSGTLSFESDKTHPHQLQPKGAGKKQPLQTQSTTQQATTQSQPCNIYVLLVMDDVRSGVAHLYNYPPNSTFSVTMTQTNAGIIEYSNTATDPFSPTIILSITTDSSGYGESSVFYVRGANVGQTTNYGEVSNGNTTTTNDLSVLPQCNCPPIPVVP